MFKFLKDKIKKTVSNISDKIKQKDAEEHPELKDQEEQPEEEQREAPQEPESVEPSKKELETSQAESEDQPEDSQKETPQESIKEPSVEPEVTELPSEPAKTSQEETSQPKEKSQPVELEQPKILDESPTDSTESVKSPSSQETSSVELETEMSSSQAEETLVPVSLPKEPQFETQEKEEPIQSDKQETQAPQADSSPLVSEKKTEEIKEIQEEKPEEIKEKTQEKTLENTPSPSESDSLPLKEEPQTEDTQETEQPKGFFAKLKQKVTSTTISSEQFDDLFWDLELAMLENNVAVEVIERMKDDLKAELVDQPLPRGGIEEAIAKSLRTTVADILIEPELDIEAAIKAKKEPYVICFVGINGSGKTTSIAKVANRLKNNGHHVVLAAADTFRAAAIDQLQDHANRLGLKMIKHDYGSDPAAVAFDAIKHAQSKDADVVLIDTAGRMHSNQNLQDEMKKIIRIAQPDLKLFVGESITGNDCVEQAKQFDSSITIDGIILSKADIDEKGGAALSVSYITKKPIFFLGIGQEYADLKPFSTAYIMENLGL